MKTWYNKVGLKIKWYHIALIYLLQNALFQIMIQLIFPAIEHGTGGLQILDMMKHGYDVPYVVKLVDSMKPPIRNLYLNLQMPLDFIYPVIMAAVFYCLFAKAWVGDYALYFLAVFTLIYLVIRFLILGLLKPVN